MGLNHKAWRPQLTRLSPLVQAMAHEQDVMDRLQRLLDGERIDQVQEPRWCCCSQACHCRSFRASVL